MNDFAHTGKSQASALDVHSKIEYQFLQRYAQYIIQDEMDNLVTSQHIHMMHVLDPKRVTQEQYISFKTQLINTQQPDKSVFFALRAFTFHSFSSSLDKLLEQSNVYTRDDYVRSIRTVQDANTKKQMFLAHQPNSFSKDEHQRQNNVYLLYSNESAKQQNEVLQGEIIFFHTLIKCVSIRSLAYDLKKKIEQTFKSFRVQNQVVDSEYLPYLKEYKYRFISVIILFNGDVNSDFEQHLPINSVKIMNMNYELKIKVYYISKLALFSHFRETNSQQKIDCITDKIVTFYDMTRIRKRRAKILQETERLQQASQKKDQNKLMTQRLSVAAAVIVVAIALFFKRKH